MMSSKDRSKTHVRRWEDFTQPMDLVEKANWMAWVILDQRLSPTAKAVAAALAFKYHNTKSGRCNPSYQRIANEMLGKGRDTSAVERAIRDLRSVGWIDRKIVLKDDGSNSSCSFKLMPPPDGTPCITPAGVHIPASDGIHASTPDGSHAVTSCSTHADTLAASMLPGGGVGAAITHETNRGSEAGERTDVEITFMGGARGGCAALTGSVVGLTPSSSPVGNERHTGEEEKEDTTGLRENSAAQVPPEQTASMNDLIQAIATWMISAYSPGNINRLRENILDPGRRRWLLECHGIALDGVDLSSYDDVFNAAMEITLARNAPFLQIDMLRESREAKMRELSRMRSMSYSASLPGGRAVQSDDQPHPVPGQFSDDPEEEALAQRLMAIMRPAA